MSKWVIVRSLFVRATGCTVELDITLGTVRASMETGTQNRVRLWLRGERALGLSSVPVTRSAVDHIESGPILPSVVPSAAHSAIASNNRRADAQVRAASHAKDVESEPMLIAPIPAASSGKSFSEPSLAGIEKQARLIALNDSEVRGCTRCRLCEGRTNTVFGEGSPDAAVFFIGEGPGENEDLQGRPFVGRAGDMLNKWIAAMGLRREDVYIANIVKCRPPNNRVPMPDEVATCTPYLEQQLEIIRPRVIVTLGLPSLKYMMNDPKLAMGRSRGTWREWRGIKLMPTYHPAYVLRQYTEETRAAVWSDLKMVMAEIGLPAPKRS